MGDEDEEDGDDVDDVDDVDEDCENDRDDCSNDGSIDCDDLEVNVDGDDDDVDRTHTLPLIPSPHSHSLATTVYSLPATVSLGIPTSTPSRISIPAGSTGVTTSSTPAATPIARLGSAASPTRNRIVVCEKWKPR